MLEIMKAVANAVLVSQGTNVGLKVINKKNVTNKEVDGLIIAILIAAVLNSDVK